jgi:hypothetical protein
VTPRLDAERQAYLDGAGAIVTGRDHVGMDVDEHVSSLPVARAATRRAGRA